MRNRKNVNKRHGNHLGNTWRIKITKEFGQVGEKEAR
jgi:hypothetical protein